MYKSLRIRLVILLITAPCLIQAQVNGALKVNLTSAIDIFSFPALTFSYEHVISNKWTVAGELGYQLYGGNFSDTLFVHPHGLRANVSARYYLKKHAPFGIYAEGSIFFTQHRYNTMISYHHRSDTATYHDAMWTMQRQGGINLIAGYQRPMGKNLLLDLYCGLGLMRKDIQNHNREFTEKLDSLGGTDLAPLFAELKLSESSGVTANLTIGVRIGYVFKCKVQKSEAAKPD